MTTATLTTGRPAAAAPTGGALARLTRIVRLNTVNPWTTIALPWMIMGVILVVNIAIWALLNASVSPDDLGDALLGTQYSGASLWIFFYMMVLAIQAMNLTFPLALGYGATRRDFSLGSILTFVLLSAMFAIGLTLLSVIEQITGGWGLGGHMFSSIYFGGTESQWYVKLAIFFCGMVFFFLTGSLFGSVFVRWRAFGVTVTLVIMAVLVVGIAAIVTVTRSWTAVGEFVIANQALGIALWLLVPAVVAGLVGFAILQRATPRS